MSRHRAVRGMNLDDEYDDDDEYYSQSVEDNFCISPGTAAQFTFNRGQTTFATYMGGEDEVEAVESDDDVDHQGASSGQTDNKLNAVDQAKLNSCLEEIHNILGECRPDSVYRETIIKHNFSLQASLDELLSQKEAPKPQRAPRQNRRNKSQGDSDSDEASDTESDARAPDSGKGETLVEINQIDHLKQSNTLSSICSKAHIGGISELTKPVSTGAGLSLADFAKGPQSQSGIMASHDWIKNNVCLNSNIPKLSGLIEELGQMKVDEAQLMLGHKMEGRSTKSSLSSSTGSDSGMSLSQLALMHQQQKQTQPSIQAPRPTSSSGDPASAVSVETSVSAGINITQGRHFKTFTGSPKSQSSSLGSDSSLSLAELASRHQQTHSKGGYSPSSSLAELAKQHSPTKSAGTVSLSVLAQQHSLSTVQGTGKGLSSQVPISERSAGLSGLGSFTPGLSLAQLASSHKATQSTPGLGSLAPASAAMKPGSQLGGVSLANLAKGHKHSDQSKQLPIGNTSASSTPKPEGTLCLSDLLKSKVTISGSRQSSVDRTPSPNDTSSSFTAVQDEITLLVKVQCDATLQSTPSILGKALCLLKTRKRKASGSDKFSMKYPRFMYAVQAKGVKHHTPVHKREVKLFDFSTPSPDDLVRQRQRGAFTRTGERHVSSYRHHKYRCTYPERSTFDFQVPEFHWKCNKFNFESNCDSKEGACRGFEPVVATSTKSDDRLAPQVATSCDNVTVGLGGAAASTSETTLGESTMPLASSSTSSLLTPKKDPAYRPPLPRSSSKSKQKINVQEEYTKRQGEMELLNLVVIGHVDAGKSTLMGHLLYQLGSVNKKAMHKYEQESKKLGKGSFAFAWVLDETEEERTRGVTMDVAQTKFQTPKKIVTLLDAPGHKDFIPNMITGAAQADVAILVINATKGEFETGFETGGQTREHALLARSLGVAQIIVAVNKMDTVDWSEDRYNEVVKKIGQFLKQAGFREGDVSFVPCSGLGGENLTQTVKEPKLAAWYKGPTLSEQIDKFKSLERPIDKPFRLNVGDVFKGQGTGFRISGRIGAGYIQAGDRAIVMPGNVTATVRNVFIDEMPVQVAFAGDHVTILISGIDIANVNIGSVLCDPVNPAKFSTRIRAKIVIFSLEVPITRGYPVVFHYQSVSEPAVIRRLLAQLNKSTGEVVKKKPRCLVKNTSAVVEIELERNICLEEYKDFKDLGRFMLRSGGATIAAGLVEEILPQKVKEDQ
ncbi:LOW QUALITY PROTEIN: HBS1-like protein [Haliotis rubra]|uniref:LOW QUALITY PROTEIN: HBS1-like protein n=1 Tax=Haliotis rubra TaxID=36100 RepID=UPI001EE5B498|nr:LOW QUALITY PROTEIN: HBS1-like protein [Haliotis rubra]